MFVIHVVLLAVFMLVIYCALTLWHKLPSLFAADDCVKNALFFIASVCCLLNVLMRWDISLLAVVISSIVILLLCFIRRCSFLIIVARS